MVEAARALQQDRAGRDDEPQPAGGHATRSSSSTRAASARSTWRAACASSRGPRIGKYPGRPDGSRARQYKLNVEATASSRPTTPQYLSKVDYDLWLGPAPKRPFNRNRFHYNWHWHWDYGNGDTGNQGPHQFDIARWGLGKQEHPVKVAVDRRLLRRPRSSQETPDMQTSLFEYADGTILEFAHARRVHQRRGRRRRSATCSTAPRAGSGSTETARKWQSYFGPRRTRRARAPTDRRTARQRPRGSTSDRVPALPELHRRDPRRRSEDPDCDILEGHLSSTLPHLANISYRVGHALDVRRQDRDVRRRQEGRRAPDARIPQGLRDPEVVHVAPCEGWSASCEDEVCSGPARCGGPGGDRPGAAAWARRTAPRAAAHLSAGRPKEPRTCRQRSSRFGSLGSGMAAASRLARGEGRWRPGFPTAAQLDKTDVLVMFAANAGTILGDERTRLETFLKRGGGIVCLHDSVVTAQDPHWFKTIVGGAWENGVASTSKGRTPTTTSTPSTRSPGAPRISRSPTKCTGICT